MKSTKYLLGILLLLLFFSISFCNSPDEWEQMDTIPYDTYPAVIDENPDLPSPFRTTKGEEYVVAVTKENKYAIIEVSLRNEGRMCPQLIVDTADFPELVKTGLHGEERLHILQTITGRSLEKITELGRPGGLSQAGFLAEDETILSVIKGDNHLVTELGLTHPQLAKPLFHVLNMMDTDLSLDRWNMARHSWENIPHFFYHNQKVFVEAEDTKGGQQSIFDDGIGGGFFIKIWRELNGEEEQYLEEHYAELSSDEMTNFKRLLSSMNTGEMQPQYIMRYGFYEGHTYWRTDPIAISFIFGLKSLEELDRVFDGELYKVLTGHFVE
jgi:hypothetical protein